MSSKSASKGADGAFKPVEIRRRSARNKGGSDKTFFKLGNEGTAKQAAIQLSNKFSALEEDTETVKLTDEGCALAADVSKRKLVLTVNGNAVEDWASTFGSRGRRG